MTHQLTQDELDCLRSVQRAADELGIAIVVVGANARRLVFDLANGIPIHRTTNDWDFGVRVPDWGAFRQMRSNLVEQTDAFISGRYEHRLTHKASGINIDLVPFGGLENDGRIRWPDSAFEMNVFGFSEASENAAVLDFAPDLRMAVPTVPLLVALKVFAFADRRHATNRDLSDLWHVIRNYVLSGRETELYDEPLGAIVDEAFDWDYAGPLLLGYDLARACKPATIERLLPILELLTDPYCNDIGALISRFPSAEQEEQERRRVSASFRWLMRGMRIAR
ncbi:MAG: hypothetical protein JWN51_3192 [Phycisphaerales bacterium]|nr:hypothetical protein [Phycisphaerales bacterium]